MARRVSRAVPWIAFALLAVAAAVPTAMHAGNITIPSGVKTCWGPLRHLYENLACWDASPLSYLFYALPPGSTANAAEGRAYTAFLMPFFDALGPSVRAVTAAAIAAHLIVAGVLAWIAVRFLPSRNPLWLGLPFFCSPWYRGVIFSRSGQGVSLMFAFVAVALFLAALRRPHWWRFAAAGLASGVCLHGYTGYRVVPFLLLAFLGAWWAASRAGDRASRRTRAVALVLLIEGMLVPVWPNLIAEPAASAAALFSDTETPLGQSYWDAVANTGTGPVEVAKRNLGELFTQAEVRDHRPGFDAALWLLAAAGLLSAIRRRDPAGLLAGALFAGLGLLGSPFMICWTGTRIGPVALPVLLLAGLGLAAVAAVLRRVLPRSAGAVASALIAAGFVAVSVPTNAAYVDVEAAPAPINEPAAGAVARVRPIRTVLGIGGVGMDEDALYAFTYKLAETRRTEEACALAFVQYATPAQIAEAFDADRESTVLVVWPGTEPDPASVEGLSQTRYESGFTVYTAQRFGDN